MINEILCGVVNTYEPDIPAPKPLTISEALTAIYEIGLEAMPKKAEPIPVADSSYHSGEVQGWNDCLEAQRKAWAKACGVAEK